MNGINFVNRGTPFKNTLGDTAGGSSVNININEE